MEVIASYKERLRELKAVVIVPTYNNRGTIADVIASLKEYSSDIMIVNDGSTDDTLEILNAIEGIQIQSYPVNKGKGYALKYGLGKAYEQGFRYAITIDADGQHFADDLPVFIKRIEEVPDSLLIGARNLTADNMPGKNTFANRFSNFWYKVETGQELSDTQSGYRLYPLDKIQNIHFFTSRYEFEVEIIVRAAWRGVNVENVPIKVYYPPVEERVSHFRPFHDFFRISILNTVLVLYAFLIWYPWRFVRSLTWTNIKNFFSKHVFDSKESNIRMAASMGWGIFCGIIPLWGYQMVFAALSAHFMKLNKIVALVFSNISIPPMIPFILYGSVWTGALILREPIAISFIDISLDNVAQSLLQYLIGSVSLAAVLGVLTTAVGWTVMVLCKRGRK
jgi:glycosyltransferase involved in cell wall biosynthesis